MNITLYERRYRTMEYIGNKILGGIVYAYVFIMSIIYGFMLVANMYESAIAAFVTFGLLLVLYFIGIVEWNAEYYDNLGKNTKIVRG